LPLEIALGFTESGEARRRIFDGVKGGERIDEVFAEPSAAARSRAISGGSVLRMTVPRRRSITTKSAPMMA